MSETNTSSTQTATIAGGCFWGLEHLYRKQFGNDKGLTDLVVGYTGGETNAPTYRRVASGTTGRQFAPIVTLLRLNQICIN